MKYLMACLFSLGFLISANAQDTTQQQQEEDVITCVYLDENTITCFDPEYMEGPELEEEQMEDQKQEEWMNQEQQGELQDTSGEARLEEEEFREEEETEVIPEEELLKENHVIEPGHDAESGQEEIHEHGEARGELEQEFEDPNEPIQDTTNNQRVDPWSY